MTQALSISVPAPYSKCQVCGQVNNSATGVGKVVPNVVLICSGCGSLRIVRQDMSAEVLAEDELAQIMHGPQGEYIASIQKRIRARVAIG